MDKAQPAPRKHKHVTRSFPPATLRMCGGPEALSPAPLLFLQQRSELTPQQHLDPLCQHSPGVLKSFSGSTLAALPMPSSLGSTSLTGSSAKPATACRTPQSHGLAMWLTVPHCRPKHTPHRHTSTSGTSARQAARMCHAVEGKSLGPLSHEHLMNRNDLLS